MLTFTAFVAGVAASLLIGLYGGMACRNQIMKSVLWLADIIGEAWTEVVRVIGLKALIAEIRAEMTEQIAIKAAA